jgi:hypothetical protein
MEEKNQEVSQEQIKVRQQKMQGVLQKFLGKQKEVREEDLTGTVVFTATDEERAELAAFGKRHGELKAAMRMLAAEIYEEDKKRLDWWNAFEAAHPSEYDKEKYYLRFDFDTTNDVVLIRRDKLDGYK